MSDDTQVKEQFSLHHSYSMIPNVIFELGLDQYAFRLYCQYKKIAGDGGECWVSAPNLAAQCGMSESKLREAKMILASKFDKLGGLSLIEITKRQDEKGNHKSDVITIVDIWVENIKICKSKKTDTGSQKNPGVGCQKTHPGSQKTGHYVEQELLNKKTTTREEAANAAVVVPPAAGLPDWIREEFKDETELASIAKTAHEKNYDLGQCRVMFQKMKERGKFTEGPFKWLLWQIHKGIVFPAHEHCDNAEKDRLRAKLEDRVSDVIRHLKMFLAFHQNSCTALKKLHLSIDERQVHHILQLPQHINSKDVPLAFNLENDIEYQRYRDHLEAIKQQIRGL